MSLQNQRYNLRSGPFGLCTGYWDENERIYKGANRTQELDCCLSNCKPFIEECKTTCQKIDSDYIKGTCEQTCEDIKNNCEDNCKLSSENWGVNNPIFNSIGKYGCGDGYYKPIDNNCIRKNKKDILLECKKSCIPTNDINCDEHCEYSYNLIYKSEDKTTFLSQRKMSSQYGVVSHLTKDYMYILYSFSLSVIILGIYILFSSL